MSAIGDWDVGVVGAGTMGAGIAQVAAAGGHRTLILDTHPGAARDAIESIGARMAASVAKGNRSETAAAAVMERLSIANSLSDLRECDLIIEAIVEDLDVKKALFADLEAMVRPDAVLASNTSSLSITDLASDLQLPGRVVGMHFFNPAPAMDLVEVISGLGTDPETADRVFELATAWGKRPVRCLSTPGFIGNYVNRPFYLEGLRSREEGLADERTIDALVAGAGGFPLGPFQLIDLVGVDVNLAVSDSVWKATGRDPRFEPSGIQRTLVKLGKLGRKAGHGFYKYETGTHRAPRTVSPGPQPSSILVGPTAGGLDDLVKRARTAGVGVEEGAELDGIEVGGVRLVLTDGYTAAEHTMGTPLPAVVVDWFRPGARSIGLAASVGNALPVAGGLLSALDIQPILLADRPGLVLARTLSCIFSLARETVLNEVATADDVDLAMVAGFNYPEGPLSWANSIGTELVNQVLERLEAGLRADRYSGYPGF